MTRASRRIVIAPDGFKGTITAAAAADALAEGWRSVAPHDELVLLPMADGGEGTLDAFARAVPGAERVPVTVTGPDGRATDAAWLRLPPTADAPAGTAVVELAAVSGIELLRGALRPLDAHTAGLGQAIGAALDAGVSRVVIGIGGSASTDGGLGALVALGARATDAAGAPVPSGARGLLALDRLDLDGLRAVPPRGAIVLTDVTNPLAGPRGAAVVFGPQKGLVDAEIRLLDAALGRLAARLGVDPDRAGAGAAGGTGAALLAWGAELAPGAPAVAELLGLDAAIGCADLVVTGEGSYDAQSASGKAAGFVVSRARRHGVAVAVVAGRIDAEIDRSRDIHLALDELAGTAEAAMTAPGRWLREAGSRLAAASGS